MQWNEHLFSKGLVTEVAYRATLHIQPGANPRLFKPQLVPFSIRGAIGSELDRLVQEGILLKPSSSNWAVPIIRIP